MENITTKDGSITHFNKEFDEYYHSLSGAYEEALEKHVKPILLFLKEQKLYGEEIHIFDFCFGLGYNSFVFFEEYLTKDKHKTFCEAVEIDPLIIASSKELFPKWWDSYEDFISLKQEDAETFIPKPGFHVCFFDPFSPKKCPKLWTKEVFQKIYNNMNTPGILTTYSCARSAREAMKEAGFIIKDGPTIGRNAPATLAIKL